MITFYDARTGIVTYGKASACNRCGWVDTFYSTNGTCLSCLLVEADATARANQDPEADATGKIEIKLRHGPQTRRSQ